MVMKTQVVDFCVVKPYNIAGTLNMEAVCSSESPSTSKIPQGTISEVCHVHIMLRLITILNHEKEIARNRDKNFIINSAKNPQFTDH
jgi:hypothetical protein